MSAADTDPETCRVRAVEYSRAAIVLACLAKSCPDRQVMVTLEQMAGELMTTSDMWAERAHNR
jgi:hypothetical protein